MEYKPVNFLKRGDEQLSADTQYVFQILQAYRMVLDRLALPLSGLSIVEIGPGPNFGTQLLLASMGSKVTLADRFLSRFDPDYHPKLYAEVAKQWDGPDHELKAAISGGHEATSLRFVAEPAENMKSIADTSIDFVYSNAVLEHVSDIGAVTSELARITKPGGSGTHQIDWRDHRDFSRPLEHLVMEEALFQDLAPPLAYEFGNRLRMIEYRAHFEASGFSVTEEFGISVAEATYFADVMPRIRCASSVYRYWPEDDLRRICGCLVTRRLSGEEEAGARSRGAELLSMIRSLKTAGQEQHQQLIRDNKIVALNGELSACEGKIEKLSTTIVSMNQVMAERDQQIGALDETIKNILQSRSWRYTAPMRWFRNLTGR